MTYKRKFKTKNHKIIKQFSEHILRNKKDYFKIIIIFLCGIIAGVFILNQSDIENQKNISGYIISFIKSIKQNEYQIDTQKLLINSIISNLKLAGIIWIAGSTIIGIPAVYGCVAYKGICIGYTISAIIAVLDKSNGILFSISSMLLQNIISIPCIFAIAVSSCKMYKSVIKNKNKPDIKYEIYRHTMFSFFMTIGLIISSIVEVFISTNFVNWIILNYIK